MVSSGGGKATLQWNTRPDMFYTVMYTPRRKGGAQWKPLPAYTRVPGTGGTVIITDTIPRGSKRFYRLHIEPRSSAH